MKTRIGITGLILTFVCSSLAMAEPVGITPEMSSVE